MYQKKYINVIFNEGLGIFDNQCGYPEIDDLENHSSPTDKIKDIREIREYSGKLQRGYRHLRIFIDHGLPVDGAAIRPNSTNDMEVNNTCLT